VVFVVRVVRAIEEGTGVPEKAEIVVVPVLPSILYGDGWECQCRGEAEAR
jgi:hypothetical protein